MDETAKREELRLERAYKRDEKDFPWCNRSKQSEQNCSTNEEGQYVCEIFSKLTRFCENADPVDIFTSKRTVNQPASGLLGSSGFSQNFNHRRSSSSRSFGGSVGDMDLKDLAGGLEQMIKEMERQHELQKRDFEKRYAENQSRGKQKGDKLQPPRTQSGGRKEGPEEEV